jgi:hypothetical protein
MISVLSCGNLAVKGCRSPSSIAPVAYLRAKVNFTGLPWPAAITSYRLPSGWVLSSEFQLL